MALEDGVMLARCLRDASTTDAALMEYEELRRDRVERVVRQGRRNGSGKTPGTFGRAMRDFALRIFFSRFDGPTADQQLGWLFDYHIAWEA